MKTTAKRNDPLIKPGNHVLVVGLGRSGRSAVKFLLALGMRVSVSEGGRPAQLDEGVLQGLEEKGVFVETGGHSSELFTAADCIVASPGVPLSSPALMAARERGVPVVGELALAPDYLRTPVIAITGTNGKSTVTTLVGELLAASGKKVFVGGNLGVPLTDYLAGPQEADAVVLEVSSFQLDTAADFRAEVAVLLNISPDHLDRYDGFGGYAASKLRIFANQAPDDWAVLNGDDQEVMRALAGLEHGDGADCFSGRKVFFGAGKRGGQWVFREGEKVILASSGGAAGGREAYDLQNTGLAGTPNRENAMAAILAARLAGATPEGVTRGIARFRPLPHRLQWIAEKDGVSFYDDSKATNIGAVRAALAAMRQPVVLVAGGRDKGGDYALLEKEVRRRVKAVVLLGEAREKMAAALGGITTVSLARDMVEAVNLAYGLAGPGDAVLLSPGCASFDMFESYAHRGRVFQAAVAALVGKQGGRSDGALFFHGAPVA